MAIIKIEIKPIKNKKDESILHVMVDDFVNLLNSTFGLVVDEYSKPVFKNGKS